MDDLLDLFDRDSRRRNGSRRSPGGLRNLLNRLADGDDDRDRRARYPNDDDDGPRAGGRSRRRQRDGVDLFDL